MDLRSRRNDHRAYRASGRPVNQHAYVCVFGSESAFAGDDRRLRWRYHLEAAKAFVERAFGIGDRGGEGPASGGRGRATVRHVTPYLFVTKEVIYSETVLLHGLKKADKARDILAAMPYFLRVHDEASVVAEQRLRQLQRALDKEEVRERSRAAANLR